MTAHSAPARYRMDAATLAHLAAWCDRETHNAEESGELIDRMAAMLEDMEPEDAEYSMSHGWFHVRDLL